MDQVENNSPTPSLYNRKTIVLGVFLWILTLLWTFGGGYLFKDLLSKNNSTQIPTLPITSSTPIPTIRFPSLPISESIDFIPFLNPERGAGNAYFNDTLTVLVESTPPQLIVSTYTVGQSGVERFSHTARASYFDGQQWHRNVDSEQSSTSIFIPNDVITSMQVFQDRNRVLRQKINSQLNIDGVVLDIRTNILENEIPMRAEPTYTRLVSDSTGTVRINNDEYPARVMYTKWYSMDQSKLSFYNSSYGLKTHVIDFWAEDGSVFHLDSTEVKNPDEIYSSHHIGIYKDAQGRVAKTFDLNIETGGETPPAQWAVQLGNTLHFGFKGVTLSSLNRAEGENYDWYRGILDGEIELDNGQKIRGIGTFEYINEF